MLTNISETARQALQLAFQESQRRGAASVETSDVLLGLLKIGQGAATAILQHAGLDLRTIRDAVEAGLSDAPTRVRAYWAEINHNLVEADEAIIKDESEGT